jgi:hypothetical protein
MNPRTIIAQAASSRRIRGGSARGYAWRALLLCGLLASGGAAQARDLLEGEYGDIDLGRTLVEPATIPTLSELRELVRKPQITTVLLLKLYGDANNHNLPVWSDDGRRLAFQRSDVGARSSKLLLFNALSQARPDLLSTDPDAYDYMFRWGVNSSSGFVFARIDRARAATQIYFSAQGEPPVIKTPGAGRHIAPCVYQRTDGIWRLAYERDGELVEEAWNSSGPVEANVSLGRGSSPRWARDGFRLALLRERPGPGQIAGAEIVVRNLKTDAEIVLSTEPADRVRSPSWSPDERYVAYYSRPAGDQQSWRIGVASLTEGEPGRMLGQQVVANLDFESQGPSWEPSGRRIWYFSHAQKEHAYYPLVAADVRTGETTLVDYPTRCTTPGDLAVNPAAETPQMAFVAHDGLTQDLFIVFLNHY